MARLVREKYTEDDYYGYMPFYLINVTKDGTYLSNQGGLILEPEKTLRLAKEITKFATKYKNEIIEYNKEQERINQEEMEGWRRRTKKSKNKKDDERYIYLFECNGKYKIGVTKDVEKRLRQLNNRPFEVKLVEKTKLVTQALEKEQKLHSELSSYIIDGEWYDFNEEQLNTVIAKIKMLK